MQYIVFCNKTFRGGGGEGGGVGVGGGGGVGGGRGLYGQVVRREMELRYIHTCRCVTCVPEWAVCDGFFPLKN
jgi:hypothetical protein